MALGRYASAAWVVKDCYVSREGHGVPAPWKIGSPVATGAHGEGEGMALINGGLSSTEAFGGVQSVREGSSVLTRRSLRTALVVTLGSLLPGCSSLGLGKPPGDANVKVSVRRATPPDTEAKLIGGKTSMTLDGASYGVLLRSEERRVGR